MYYLHSSFDIQKKENIEQLARLYKNVCGELQFECESRTITIQWTNNPFDSLLKNLDGIDESFVFRDGGIVCRLCGPSTLLAVAFQPTKILLDDFEHPEKHVLLQWADFIDECVGFRMKEDNGLDLIMEPPTIPLQNSTQLLLAIRLSKFGTHVLPIKRGFLVANTKSYCWSCVSLSNNKDNEDEQPVSLYFDKDDGFGSPFCSQTHPSIQYLNERYFKPWKENGLKDDLFADLGKE